MRKLCKKLIAVFCVLMLVSGSVLMIDFVQADAETITNVIFREDFNSYGNADVSVNKSAMAEKGWNPSNTTVTYNTGSTYAIPYDKTANLVLSNLTGASEWTDYAVEAKLTLQSDTNASGATVAGIAGRVTDASAAKKGYDLIVYKVNTSREDAQLRLRCDGTALATVTIDSLPVDTEFTLKLEFDGTVIKGYLNNELKITYDTVNDATKYAAGYAGVRKSNATGFTTMFDDFSISTVTEVVNPEETVSNRIFSDDFNSYNNSDAAVNKTAMTEKGWNASNTSAAYSTGTAYTIPYDKAANLVLSNLSSASEWTDYLVEAKLTLQSNANASGATVAGIAGRVTDASNAKRGYDLIVYKVNTEREDAQLRLRCDGTELARATIDSLSADTEFMLELEFDGTVIKGYFNGELKITYDTVNDETKYSAGYAGIRKSNATGFTASFDDFVVSTLLEMDIPDGYYYYNDFSESATLVEEGWDNDTAITKQEEMLQLSAGSGAYLTGVTRSARWTDYIVESDVKIVSGTATTGCAGLVVRSTDATNTGYELRMVYDNGTTSVILCKNGITDTVLGTYYLPFELDTFYKLTVAVCGNNIMCWFDDTLVFDYIDTDNAYLKGYTGVRSSGETTSLSSVYDNYAVREYVEPETVYPEGYLYFNAFQSSKDLTEEGWRNNGTKTDGAYVLGGASFNYLTGIESSSEWTDYVVEADVKINDDGTLSQYASIVARSTNLVHNGYEYRLVQDESGTYIWLYKRGADGGKINGDTYKFHVSVKPGEYNHMKMVVNGAEIICYFNGIRFFHMTDENPYLTGYVGLRSPSGTATQSYDNFGVREVLETDLAEQSVLEKGEGDIWFYDDFTGEDALTDRGWNTDNMEIHNGAVKVYGRFYVDGIEGCEKWTDYEVSAVVTVDKNGGLIGTATGGWASICARTLSATTGYEFGIVSPESSVAFLRLNDRAAKKTTDDKSIAITEGAHTLRMVCIGNEITCYYDGELVFVVQSDSSKAGYAGLRASGYNTYYQEFTVGKASLTNSVRPGVPTSPATADPFGYAVNISVVAFILSALGLSVTLIYGRKIKNGDIK